MSDWPKEVGGKLVNAAGEVAVLYSPGHGAGWSTWSAGDYGSDTLFCPELARAVLRKAPATELKEIAKRLFPEAYDGGVSSLAVEWLPVGTAFRIHEYDGSESVEVCTQMDWTIA